MISLYRGVNFGRVDLYRFRLAYDLDISLRGFETIKEKGGKRFSFHL